MLLHFLSLVVHHLAYIDALIQRDFLVIQKIALTSRLHDYFIFNFLLKSQNVRQERGKLRNLNTLKMKRVF